MSTFASGVANEAAVSVALPVSTLEVALEQPLATETKVAPRKATVLGVFFNGFLLQGRARPAWRRRS
jgi:hypothetical protein